MLKDSATALNPKAAAAMHMPDTTRSGGRSPRMALQGPRPTPLKVHDDSHKIRKPPVAPQPAAQPHRRPPPHAPPRSPVVIYAVSPKIIHTNADDFMSLVQRLTGPSPCNSPSTASSPLGGGAVSPAARFASIEKARSPRSQIFPRNTETMESIEIGTDVLMTTAQFPGILSPDPSTLPPVSLKFLSPPSDDNSLSFFFDLSPVLQSNRNYLENNFILPSPSALMISPQINFPSPNTVDLFHTLFDL